MMNSTNHLFGFDVIIVPVIRIPRLQLSPGVPVSEACRTEMDAWLLSRFGAQEYCTMTPGMSVVDRENGRLYIRDDEVDKVMRIYTDRYDRQLERAVAAERVMREFRNRLI